MRRHHRLGYALAFIIGSDLIALGSAGFTAIPVINILAIATGIPFLIALVVHFGVHYDKENVLSDATPDSIQRLRPDLLVVKKGSVDANTLIGQKPQLSLPRKEDD